MRLENVYKASASKTELDGINFRETMATEEAIQILYELMGERESHQNISHKEMPTMDEHVQFVDSDPYKAWFLIEVPATELIHEVVGSIYLTHQNEIGIQLFKQYIGKGYGAEAVNMLMDAFEGPFLMNISPENSDSIRFFEGLGGRHIQNTYKIDTCAEEGKLH